MLEGSPLMKPLGLLEGSLLGRFACAAKFAGTAAFAGAAAFAAAFTGAVVALLPLCHYCLRWLCCTPAACFDIIKLLALGLVLILRFLRGARDARRKGPEDGSGVLQGSGKSARRCTAREDIFAVEAHAPVRELAIIGGKQEPCLGHLSLVHAKAPEREELDVGVDVALVKFLLSVVRVDVRLHERPRSDRGPHCGGKGRG
jgi:hypothetical protein